MWDEPYLETCCRAALHRVVLAGAVARPAESKDTACLARLVARGLVAARTDGRFVATAAGRDQHAALVMRAGPS